MKTLPLDATDDAILAAVREWVNLLAAERYQEAYDYLHPGSAPDWSPQLIQTLIHNYGSLDSHPSGTVFHVTPLENATTMIRPAVTSGSICPSMETGAT